MSKQTAVEWLIGMISYTSKDTHSAMESSNFFDKAKAMEREQIEQSYYDGTDLNSMFTTAPKYYEQTYGKEAGHEG